MGDWTIRVARTDDIAALADVERASDRLFPEGRLPPGDATYTLEGLRASCAAGLLLVAEIDCRIAGFAFCEPADGRLHLTGLAVHPDFGRRGIGAALVECVIAEARGRGLAGVTLTTFEDLPWNAPFYRRLGFRLIEEGELTPFLQATLTRERAVMRERVAMLLETRLQGRT